MMQPNPIDCERARALVADGAHLVDVRTPQEFAQGALPGAVNVPLQELFAGVQQFESNRPLVLYCASGARSHQAAQALSLFGRDGVHDLGGIRNAQCL